MVKRGREGREGPTRLQLTRGVVGEWRPTRLRCGLPSSFFSSKLLPDHSPLGGRSEGLRR
jgi:hypothetical protein